MPEPTITAKMPKKQFWKSKTFWSGFGTIALGVFMLAKGNVAEGITAIATGAGAIFGRANATTEITLSKPEPVTPP